MESKPPHSFSALNFFLFGFRIGLGPSRPSALSLGMALFLQPDLEMKSDLSGFGRAYTSSQSSLEILPVEVQVLIRRGLPRFDIIGLPQHMIREGKDRILSSLHSLQIELPAKRILVNLLPGDQPKEGSHFDLPICVALFQAMGLLMPPQKKNFYWGELQLDGSLRDFPDALRHLFSVADPHIGSFCFSPEGIWDEEVENFLSAPVDLIEHIEELFQKRERRKQSSENSASVKSSLAPSENKNLLKDEVWNQLKGSPEQFLTWALAMTGREHLLLMGAPGQGKSLWSKASEALLPDLAVSQWKDRVRYSGTSFQISSWRDLSRPPFESPHHKASSAAIVGGGSRNLKAGAITRAHQGCLFLDEFLEFHRDVTESLREPLEEKALSIARQNQQLKLPADIQLIAATNPCPCGMHRSKKACQCQSSDFYRYQRKLSGPLLDRFHRKLWWEFKDENRPKGFEAKELRQKIKEARERKLPVLESSIPWPKLPNPRQKRLYLEKWKSWIQWHGLHSVTQKDFNRFWQFEMNWERKWNGEQI